MEKAHFIGFSVRGFESTYSVTIAIHPANVARAITDGLDWRKPFCSLQIEGR